MLNADISCLVAPKIAVHFELFQCWIQFWHFSCSPLALQFIGMLPSICGSSNGRDWIGCFGWSFGIVFSPNILFFKKPDLFLGEGMAKCQFGTWKGIGQPEQLDPLKIWLFLRIKQSNIILAQVTHIETDQEGKILYQTAEDGSLRIWDSKNLSPIDQLPSGSNHAQWHCSISPFFPSLIMTAGGGNLGDGCEIGVGKMIGFKISKIF